MRERYANLRSKLLRAGLWPVSRLAQIAWYSLRMAALLFVLSWLLQRVKPSWAQSVSGAVTFFLFVAGALYGALAARWLKTKLLWRLRNRLIVTYVFIGVVPVILLVAMAFVTLNLFAGQFASFVVTREIDAQLRNLEAANAAISNELAARLERGLALSPDSLAGLRKRDARWGRREVCAWHGNRLLPSCVGPQGSPTFAFPEFFNDRDGPHSKVLREKQLFHQLVRDQGVLYLRAASVFPVEGEKLTTVTSEPLDKESFDKIANELGEVTLYSSSGLAIEDDKQPSGTGRSNPSTSTTIKSSTDQTELLHPTFVIGALSGPANALDLELPFPLVMPLPDVDWKTGKSEPVSALVRVRTRPSLLYAPLFAALGRFAKLAEYILVAFGIVFALIEVAALIVGTRMTRTVTGAVANLYGATKHVDRGDFSHRIHVTSADQLAQLSLSFNSMTASIQKLILEQKEKQRLENELAIAQEVQAQLFPKQISELESLEVHGFCRPARTVSGDYYDFLTASSQRLILAVGDISGKGISAALLMATIHSAVRAYSVESLPQLREPVGTGALGRSIRATMTSPDGVDLSPATLLRLLNHQLYESTPLEKYATLFLGIYDGQTRRLTYSNAGHLPPLLISQDGSVRRLECGGTVVGLFDGIEWQQDCVEMSPGEIFLAYSDGVTEPENDYGEFGEGRLLDLVRANRHLPLAQISQLVTTAVDDWIGDQEQPDDVTLVLARAR